MIEVYVCQTIEPHPETRAQDGAMIEELVGVYQTRDAAELGYDEAIAYRIDEQYTELLQEEDEEPLRWALYNVVDVECSIIQTELRGTDAC